MNKKLFTTLKDKCKDMGLSDTAIQEIANTFGDGLTEQTSEEDYEKAVNRCVSVAKNIQAEATRWAQVQKKQTEDKSKEDKSKEDKNKGGQSGDDDEPAWFKKFKADQEKAMKDLKDQNEKYKSDQAKNKRSADINAKAKELGIPDYLMKRFSIADDADYEKELTDYKQDLVTNKLMPADAAGIKGDIEKAVNEAATDFLSEAEVKTEKE